MERDYTQHRYDQTVERIKSRNDIMEAREWLQAAGEDYGVIHEMSHEESVRVVEECYELGALNVEVLGNLPEDAIDASADMLLITLPEEKGKRKPLFKMEEAVANMTGYQLSVDEGQKYVLLRWT